jgi:hypothetical protein
MVTTTAHPGVPPASPPEHPAIHWGAVFAGWLVSTGIAGLLYVFGLAVGFSAFDPYETAAIQTIPAGTMVWMILTWGAALWIGAMFASWFDGSNDTEMGVVRGLTVWGLSMTATGLLIASGQARFVFLATAGASLSAAGEHAAATAHYTALAMWTAFGSAALALVASTFGGWIGAHHVHRVYHLRTYTPHVPR